MARDNSKQKPGQETQYPTINMEVFQLTYGALVLDLVRDLQSSDGVNDRLDKIGYNIGLRMVDDFLSKAHRVNRCTDWQQIADVIAKHALKTYLGVTAQLSTTDNKDEFSLLLETNPLIEFVEIPPRWKNLHYSQAICGAIRGALEAINIESDVVLVSDFPNPTEIRIKFIRHLQEFLPEE